jgi:hypothetical protein
MLKGNHFYNSTTQKTVSVFGTLFNNIMIVRPGSTEEKVPIEYSPKSKAIAKIKGDANFEDEQIAIKVPRMAFNITDISYDSARALNKYNKKRIATADPNVVNIVRQSVPYTISFQLNIIADNQTEALQIVEQILPTFTPDYTVTVKDMEGKDKHVDIPFTLGSVSFEDSYDGDLESRRTIVYSLDFTAQVMYVGEVKEQGIILSSEIVHYVVPDETEMNVGTLNGLKPDLTSQSGVRAYAADVNSPIFVDFGFTGNP